MDRKSDAQLLLPEIPPDAILQTKLEPVIPDGVRQFEESARQEKRLRNFEKAGMMFLNLANWYESQNECLLRKKWERAGHYHFMAGECFVKCAEANIISQNKNWHELASLEYSRSVECYLNNPEDIYFHREAFNLAMKEFKMIPRSQGLLYSQIEEAEKLSRHLIDMNYKKFIAKLDEMTFSAESDQLSVEYCKWKARVTTNKGLKIWFWFWGLTSNYGTSITRWVLWMLFVISLFSGFYYFTDMASNPKLTGLGKAVERFYFSVVTLSTVGYGDISPKSAFGMALVIAEIFFGQLMLGVMMTILARKIFR